jgi:energy-coupling factor transporter transmembrane protein EcfT
MSAVQNSARSTRRNRIHPVQPALFAYRCGMTLIHRIPALPKIIGMCIITIRTFVSTYNRVTYTAADRIVWLHALAYGIVTAACFILAQTPVRHLRKLLFVPVMGMIITLFRMITLFPFLSLNMAELPEGLLYTVRFFITTCAALVFFETTSRRELQDALEQVESVFRRIIPPLRRVPAALSVSIAIGFIPEIFSMWNTIILAAAARIPSDRRLPPFRRIAVICQELSALLSCMIARAEETRKAVLNRF